MESGGRAARARSPQGCASRRAAAVLRSPRCCARRSAPPALAASCAAAPLGARPVLVALPRAGQPPPPVLPWPGAPARVDSDRDVAESDASARPGSWVLLLPGPAGRAAAAAPSESWALRHWAGKPGIAPGGRGHRLALSPKQRTCLFYGASLKRVVCAWDTAGLLGCGSSTSLSDLNARFRRT
jgi:hypothetical protein